LVASAGIDSKVLRIALRDYVGLSTIERMESVLATKPRVFSVLVGSGVRVG
jgi:hypothetical protein